jgi:F-box and WD-40 domain protein CDC4
MAKDHQGGKQQQQQQTQPESSISPYTTVARMSYAPTTQTTVVTTTTTTTTTFPQLVMKPPRNLNALDPKEFPLAAIPTPAPLKRFCFDLHGKPTFFREEDDAESSIRQVRYTPK